MISFINDFTQSCTGNYNIVMLKTLQKYESALCCNESSLKLVSERSRCVLFFCNQWTNAVYFLKKTIFIPSTVITAKTTPRGNVRALEVIVGHIVDVACPELPPRRRGEGEGRGHGADRTC